MSTEDQDPFADFMTDGSDSEEEATEDLVTPGLLMLRSPSDNDYKDPPKRNPKSPGLFMLRSPSDEKYTYKAKKERQRRVQENKEKEDKRRRSMCEDGKSCVLQLRF